jgi:hypothetical protein
MLEPETYRVGERLAKARLPTWRLAQTHNVDHFERTGFPVRIASVREVGQLLDTMQENRFEKYMLEFGGLSASEYALLIEACRDTVVFQLTYLPHRPPVLPLSTLLSVFALYKKLQGVDPNFRSVLEVGPGCGYLSFLLRRHAALQNYSQIEACESFYILQSLVDLHCFGPRFDERAFVDDAAVADFFSVPDTRPGFTELSLTVRVDRERTLCAHYPWWKIGELISRELKFQVVMSNANLLEFNRAALEDYLTLLYQVMEPAGVFLVQCTGYPANGTLESLIDKIWEKGFAPLMFELEDKPVAPPRRSASASLLGQLKGTASGPVTFSVNNCLFVKAGHPLFRKYRERANCHHHFVADEPLVNDVFFARPPDRRMYTMREFVEDTEKSLASLTPARFVGDPSPGPAAVRKEIATAVS